MDEQQVREIAETAFSTHFGDVDIVCVNVKPGFDHYDDPMLEVKIIYGGEFEQLNAAGILGVWTEMVEGVVDRGRFPLLAVRSHDRQVRSRRARPGDGVTPCVAPVCL